MAQQKAQQGISDSVRKAFNDMDTDKNGVVTYGEFTDYCRKTIGCEGLVKAFCEIDTSRDQKITVDELQALCNKMDPKKIKECHITTLFHQLDKSGDGKLDCNEFKVLMQQCGYGESDIKKTFDFIAGGDGQITLDEFLHAFNNS